MKQFNEIKAANSDGDYIAIGSNGKRYDASYRAEYGVMFFCIPAGVEIIGYIER